MAGIMMTAKLLGYLRPPERHRTERIGPMVGLPVQLRRYVIHSTGLEPGYGVREDAVVLPVAALGNGIHPVLLGHSGVGASCSCGRDTELDAGIQFLYHIIYISHHGIDILPTPVAEGQ